MRKSAHRPNNILADTPPTIGHNQAPAIRLVPTDSLQLHPDDTRGFTDRDIKRTTRMVAQFGVPLPLLVGAASTVVHGQLIWLAAKANGIAEVPVVDARNLTPLQERMLGTALGRVGTLGKWKRADQRALFIEVINEMPEFDLESLAFDMGEIDLILEDVEPVDKERDLPVPAGPSVARLGDIFQLGPHRIGCGDATDPEIYGRLMGGVAAAAVFSDPPYGMKIGGFASTNKKRREFVQGSGDMTPAELEAFASRYCESISLHVRPGAIIYMCMDWRGFAGLVTAARPVFGELINLAVWKKDRAGMGSFLRSQHELVLIFAKPGGKRRNNVELGRHGRNRTNVWQYPSAVTIGHNSEEGNMLEAHATPKLIGLVADAILDSTKRGEIILDPFLGSGTTLVAAEKVGRACYGLDLDPLFVDFSIRRLQKWTGLQAVHVASGRTFSEMESEAEGSTGE